MAVIVADSYPTSRCGPVPSGARTNTRRARERTRSGRSARTPQRRTPIVPPRRPTGPHEGDRPKGSEPPGEATTHGASRGGSLPFGRSPSCRPVGLARGPDRARLRPLSRLALSRLILKTTDCDPVQGGPPRFGQAPLCRPQPCAVRRLRHSPSASESCPKPLGPKFVGFAPQVFWVHASDHPSLPSDGSRFPRATIRAPRATIRVTLPARHSPPLTAASTALPVQREWRRALHCQCNTNGAEHQAPRCQCNTNGSEHRTTSATRMAASTALPAQRERRRAPRWQCNANGGEHRAASATRMAASTALPAQRERRRAPRCQRNANGGERHAASATRTAASTVLPAQREWRRALCCQRNANGSKDCAGRATGASCGMGRASVKR
ncbi:hypothetical protein BC826DRAFT_1110295 [Russula brevipes]|nr:hypothetical protein BC826DRAFT_1110295 [Russula brevipes]